MTAAPSSWSISSFKISSNMYDSNNSVSQPLYTLLIQSLETVSLDWCKTTEVFARQMPLSCLANRYSIYEKCYK